MLKSCSTYIPQATPGVGITGDTITNNPDGSVTVVFAYSNGTTTTLTIPAAIPGAIGASITSVVFASTTDPSAIAGVAGATDTYNVLVGTDIVGNFVITNGSTLSSFVLTVTDITGGAKILTYDSVSTTLSQKGIVADLPVIVEELPTNGPINIKLQANSWVSLSPTFSTTSPLVNSINDGTVPLQAKIDLDPNFVNLKGSIVIQFNVTSGYDPALTPAAAFLNIPILNNISANFSPAANVSFLVPFVGASNSNTSPASHVIAEITNSGSSSFLNIIFDRRVAGIENSSMEISFDNVKYAIA